MVEEILRERDHGGFDRNDFGLEEVVVEEEEEEEEEEEIEVRDGLIVYVSACFALEM